MLVLCSALLLPLLAIVDAQASMQVPGEGTCSILESTCDDRGLDAFNLPEESEVEQPSVSLLQSQVMLKLAPVKDHAEPAAHQQGQRLPEGLASRLVGSLASAAHRTGKAISNKARRLPVLLQVGAIEFNGKHNTQDALAMPPLLVEHSMAAGATLAICTVLLVLSCCVKKGSNGNSDGHAHLQNMDADQLVPQDTVTTLFQERVEGQPDAVALELASGQPVTFLELSGKADLLMARINSAGFGGPSCIIATLLPEGSTDILAAAVAILTSGCVWLPLDPALPRSDLASVLAASDARLLLTKEPFGEVATGAAADTVKPGHKPAGPGGNPNEAPPKEPATTSGPQVWILQDWKNAAKSAVPKPVRRSHPAIAYCDQGEDAEGSQRWMLEFHNHERLLQEAWHLVQSREMRRGSRLPWQISHTAGAAHLFSSLISGGTLVMSPDTTPMAVSPV